MSDTLNDEQIMTLVTQFTDLGVRYGLDLLGAIAILIIGRMVAGWAGSSVLRLLNKTTRVDDTLKPFFANTVRYFILILVVIAVLSQFGIQTASLIAMLGAAGLAIGLALQGTMQNIAAGIMLLFLRPFKVGEYIDAEGISGTVNEIGLFTTHLKTYDGIYLETPNSKLWNRSIINYSRLPTRRLDIGVGIGYGDDIDKALAILMDLMVKDGRVLKDPEPATMVLELADSSVNLNMRMWTDTSNFWALKFELTKAVKQRFDAEGISIPYPQRDVHLHQT